MTRTCSEKISGLRDLTVNPAEFLTTLFLIEHLRPNYWYLGYIYVKVVSTKASNNLECSIKKLKVRRGTNESVSTLSDATTTTSVLLLMFVGTITDERMDASQHIHQCKCRLASLPCLQTLLSALDRPRYIRQSRTDYQRHGPPTDFSNKPICPTFYYFLIVLARKIIK